MSEKKDPWCEDKPFAEGWPRGVKPVTDAEVGVLGTDRAGALYFDGKPVFVRKKITFTWVQGIFAILAALATAIVAVVEVLTFLGLNQSCG